MLKQWEVISYCSLAHLSTRSAVKAAAAAVTHSSWRQIRCLKNLKALVYFHNSVNFEHRHHAQIHLENIEIHHIFKFSSVSK